MIYGKELEGIHKIQLDILQRIIEICKEHGIDYFVDSGTALGAVRHKGFIPWDDDIDIGMKRPEYNRFLEAAQEKLGDDYFLQTFQTDNDSPFYFAKVRKNGTKFVERYCRDLDMNQGIYVDIFPYDHMAENRMLGLLHSYAVRTAKNLYISKCVKGSSTPQKGLLGGLKLCARGVLHMALRPAAKKSLFNIMDRTVQRYNDKDHTPVTNWSDKKGYRSFIDNGMMYPLREIKFEHLNVKVINKVELWLEMAYGDYMTYPPECERVGHRPFLIDIGKKNDA